MNIDDNDIKEMAEVQSKMQVIVDSMPDVAALITQTASKQEAFCCGMALATVLANKAQDILIAQVEGLVEDIKSGRLRRCP